jgi:hypothetical protein
MSISSPIGTLLTYTFNPTGSAQTWTLPNHDGAIRITCVGGNGNRSGSSPNPGGAPGGSIVGDVVIATGTVLTFVPGYSGANGATPTGAQGGKADGAVSVDVVDVKP